MNLKRRKTQKADHEYQFVIISQNRFSSKPRNCGFIYDEGDILMYQVALIHILFLKVGAIYFCNNNCA